MFAVTRTHPHLPLRTATSMIGHRLHKLTAIATRNFSIESNNCNLQIASTGINHAHPNPIVKRSLNNRIKQTKKPFKIEVDETALTKKFKSFGQKCLKVSAITAGVLATAAVLKIGYVISKHRKQTVFSTDSNSIKPIDKKQGDWSIHNENKTFAQHKPLSNQELLEIHSKKEPTNSSEIGEIIFAITLIGLSLGAGYYSFAHPGSPN